MQIDEGKAREAAARGARAKALLEEPILKEAFEALEAAYTAGWRASQPRDVEGREKLFLAINIVGKVKDHLLTVLADGELAASDLRRLAEVNQRKPAWSEVR